MKFINIIFLLLNTALLVRPVSFVACSNPTRKALEEIEAYIQERPDSALVALQEFDAVSIKSKRDKALFALLYTMAKDKNDIPITDIQEIEPALEWYRRHKQGDHLAASFFYSGRIHYNSGEFPEAALSFQEALGNAESLYWKAMSTGHIAYTFNQSLGVEEELKYSLEALKLWEEYGDSYKIKQSQSTLATAYSNNRQFHKADSLLSILCNAETPYAHAFPQWAELKIKTGSREYEEIVRIFDEGRKIGAVLSPENWYEYAYALYKSGKDQSATGILNQLSTRGESIASCLWKGRIAEDEGDIELSLKYERMEKHLIDSLVNRQLSQSLYKAQTKNYKISLERVEEKRKDYVRLSITLALLLISLLTASIIFYIARRRQLETKLERAYEIAEKSNELLIQVQRENENAHSRTLEIETNLKELRRNYVHLFQNQFSEIGRLFDYYRISDNIDKEATDRYLKKTSEIVREINQGAESQRKFEDRINRNLDNIMLKLRSDFPEFKESDFLFLSYVIVGFDATTRAIILNETPNNMRVKKARLVKKILGSSSENISLYSCFLRRER